MRSPMKRHVAATLLALTTLGVINAHVGVEAQDGSYFGVWQGRKHDVMGWAADSGNRLLRDCSEVKRLNASSPTGMQALQLIEGYSPPDSRQAQLVSLLQQGDWLVAELTFVQLNPAVVLLRAEPAGLRLPERAVWSGSTAPWEPGPRIRAHLRAQAPQVPANLLACFEPTSAGLF